MSIAWPDPSPPPPPPPPPVHVPVPAVEVKHTRKKLAFWDRSKILIVIALLFAFLVWNDMADNPIIPFRDALRETARAKWWFFLAFALELVRQIHYVICEHSARYNMFWEDKVFARWNKRADRMNPWTRFRIARACKFVFVSVVLCVFFAGRWDVTPVEAFFQAPSRIYDILFSTAQGLPFIFQIVMLLGLAVGQFVAIFWFLSRGGVDTYYPDDIKTRFSDVWGQDPVLERVKENVMFLEDPEKIESKGGHVPSGILLWGPPGTGKTLMAEAVAGETGRPFVFVDPGAFTNMFFGVGILKVKSLFRKLRKLALRYGGVIVFFDEADTLGNRGQLAQGGGWSDSNQLPFNTCCNSLDYVSEHTRAELWRWNAPLEPAAPEVGGIRGFIMGAGMGGGGGGMGTLQALLTELSGLKKPRGFFNRFVRRLLSMKPKPPPKYRILVMMATNMPQALDEALLRPGRIDRIYKVGYPYLEGRTRTFQGYLDRVKHSLTPEEVEKLALMSPYATGATIKDVVNEALIVAIRDGRDTVEYADALKAKHLKNNGPADDWKYADWERHAVAIHEASHAVAMYRLQKREMIDVATIERRGGTGGFVAPVPLEEQFVDWKSGKERDVITFVASLAGERLFFEGDNSAGVGGDLQNATAIVAGMEAYAGMGSTVGSRGYMPGAASASGSVITGEDRNFLETELGRRVESRLKELLERAHGMLVEDRRYVLAIAHALETHKTITGEDIVAIFEGGRGPTLDGGVYHTDDFMISYEAYHLSVVAAHQSQGSPEKPLPVFQAVTQSILLPIGNGNGNGNGAKTEVEHSEPLPPPQER
jgi:cell division protease FtsH